MLAMTHADETLTERLDERFDRVDEKFDRFDERLVESDRKTTEQFKRVDELLAEADRKTTERFERVEERLVESDRKSAAGFERVAEVCSNLKEDMSLSKQDMSCLMQVTIGLQREMNRLYTAITRGAIGIAIALVVAVLVKGG
jgi:hypothetical protein